MIQIKNKNFSFLTKVPNFKNSELVDKINETDYFKLIIDSCNKPSDPQKGFSYDDIKSIDRVRVAISKAKKEVALFEDADFDFIKKQTANQGWISSDIGFASFMDYISNAK